MTNRPTCPHCHAVLSRWPTPAADTWESSFLFVCINDDCEYFVRGWAWMAERYGVHSSYRYYLDPLTQASGPLPVYSKDLIKNDLLPEPPESADGGTCRPQE